MRILLLSDIHSNLEALEACLDSARAYDRVVNLGDSVGYGASPNEVISRVQALDKIFVRGNHDKAAAGLMDLADFNPVAGLAALWTREQVTPEHLEWLKALPQGPVALESFEHVQLVHGSPVDEDDYVVTAQDAVAPMVVSSASLMFFGHTHLQGSFSAIEANATAFRPEYKTVGQSETVEFPLREGLRYLINPGSVGQPRDGDWRAAFGVWDTEMRMMVFCRVPYDLKRAQQKILDANLPPRLAARLAAGR